MPCTNCPLIDCPRVEHSGSFDAPLVIVGEAPGVEEVEQGRPFVGRSGQLLDQVLRLQGFDPANTFRTNMVLCRPPGNRTPTDEELAACRSRLLLELRQTTGTILALGKTASDAALGQTYGETPRRVIDAWHPAYVLRKPSAMAAFQASVSLAVHPRFAIKDPQILIPENARQLRDELGKCPSNTMVAFDLETDDVNWYDKPADTRAPILLLALCWTPEYVVVVRDDLLYDEPKTPALLQGFFDDVQTCGHNAKFDAIFLKSHLNVSVRIDFDTMLAHYILDENSKHGLKELAMSLLGMEDWEVGLKPYMSSRNDAYSKVPFEVLARYGARDVTVTRVLEKLFRERLVREGLYDTPFSSPVMVATNALVKAELHGMCVDVPYLQKCHAELDAELEVLARDARALVNSPNLNLNSPAQLAEVLYDQLKLYVVGVKPRTTAHEALIQLEGQHPFVDALQHYRRVQKIQSSYIDNLLEAVGVDGRVHPSFKIQGAETGRLSVVNPAVQTFPRPSDRYGSMIRRAVVAPLGSKLGIIDYSQAEFRVFAALSEDPYLVKAYQAGRDMHAEVAIAMYGKDYTKENRATIKMFNFAFIYGGTVNSFARDLGLPFAKAQEWVRRYTELMAVAVEWKRHQFAFLKEHGYAETVFGRRRRFPLLTSENLDEARKASVNMPIQGTASDLTLTAATRAMQEGIHVIMLVHDSIMIEEVDARIAEAATRVGDLMVEIGNEVLPEVPWKVDTTVSQEWYAKEND